MEHYAASFRKLADTFYGMPYRKDYLSSGQIETISRMIPAEQVCARLLSAEKSAGESSGRRCLLKGGKAMIRALEEGDMERAEDIRQFEWA